MRRWCGGALFSLVCLLLAGCAEQRAGLSPADAVARLRTGAPILTCREACLADWRRAQPQAAQLDAAGSWPELAALVIGTGYQDDLSLYYLGRAAEGLGFPGAAASYYRQSTYVSASSISCQYLSSVCGGLVFPTASASRIAAIDRELNRGRPRRAGRPGQAATPVNLAPSPAEPELLPLPEPSLGPPPVTVSAPPPAPAPALPPPIAAPAPSRPGPTATEYIEPPAAR